MNPTTKVQVVSGDITKVTADALIKSISHDGWAESRLDIYIKQHFGNHFHDQIASSVSLKEGQTIIARGVDSKTEGFSFSHILFVVDDAEIPLSMVVLNALCMANREGFATVTMPALRTGMLFTKQHKAGQTQEETLQAIANEIAKGVQAFLCQKSRIANITFVVQDPAFETMLNNALEANPGQYQVTE